MITIQADDLPKDWLLYLQKLQSGETLLVLQAETPVAEIKPITKSGSIARPFALCAGEFSVPDDFDVPLPDEILADFTT
jgi:antitoxin (DNA-binding transcriptional repressor) of toxin-antitoxin stability system